MEGVHMGPKERERRLAEQRVDRSHRRRGVVRRRRSPRWTLGEQAALVLTITFILSEAILSSVRIASY